jgi:flagellar assembly protein FliH
LSKVIRSEDLSDCQAWLVPEGGQGGAGTARPLTARQLEEIHNRARQEGFQQGLQEGRQQGLEEMQVHVGTLQTLLACLEKPFEQLDDAVERQLTELAMLVARQLVRRELRTEPEQIIAVVREALGALPVAARNVRLAVHPEDAALIRETLALGDSESHLQIVEDPVLSRGGCKVISDTSQIDASVEARLNAVISHVLGGQRDSDGEQQS